MNKNTIAPCPNNFGLGVANEGTKAKKEIKVKPKMKVNKAMAVDEIDESFIERPRRKKMKKVRKTKEIEVKKTNKGLKAVVFLLLVSIIVGCNIKVEMNNRAEDRIINGLLNYGIELEEVMDNE